MCILMLFLWSGDKARLYCPSEYFIYTLTTISDLPMSSSKVVIYKMRECGNACFLRILIFDSKSLLYLDVVLAVISNHEKMLSVECDGTFYILCWVSGAVYRLVHFGKSRLTWFIINKPYKLLYESIRNAIFQTNIIFSTTLAICWLHDTGLSKSGWTWLEEAKHQSQRWFIWWQPVLSVIHCSTGTSSPLTDWSLLLMNSSYWCCLVPCIIQQTF